MKAYPFLHKTRSLSTYTFAMSLCFAQPLWAQPAPISPPAPVVPVIFLEQGWDEHMRQLFYFTPQGSRMAPRDWFLALETVEGGELFSAKDNLSRFGFIYHDIPNPDLNPHNLPIGFAVDPVETRGQGAAIGLTCAACHTGEVVHNGQRIRIDGGPATLDFDTFYAELAKVIQHTHRDDERFKRFAVRVLGASHSEEKYTDLKDELRKFEAQITGDAVIRHPEVPSGFSRVDALNQIVNALAVRDLRMPENLRAVDAPVSYPQLWHAPKLDWVQWNPVASNPLARNIGQVLGVFGSTNLTSLMDRLFTSTTLVRNLIAIEDWLVDLKSPRWDEVRFGAIDTAKATRGRDLFKAECAGCHNMAPFRMTSAEDNIAGKTFIKVGRIDFRKVGTDENYMRSFVSRSVSTGELEHILFDHRPVVNGAEFFKGVVGAVTKRATIMLPVPKDDKIAANGFRFKPKEGSGLAAVFEDLKPYDPPSLTDMKAGVLLGMWATGPYLHNGSVPNIYELLSPPEERSKVFWVGGRELDTQKLGMISTEKSGLFKFDTTLKNNGNGGHVFPKNGLSHEDRMALIEYLKDPLRFAPQGYHP
jgi:mono/diheme cytochrome c family protein